MDIEAFISASRLYGDYLSKHRFRFPKSAYSIAKRNASDSRDDPELIHGSELRRARFMIAASDPEPSFELELLGPFADRLCFLRYADVVDVNIDLASQSNSAPTNRVFRNEFLLTNDMTRVMHNIETMDGRLFSIVAKDITQNQEAVPA